MIFSPHDVYHLFIYCQSVAQNLSRDIPLGKSIKTEDTLFGEFTLYRGVENPNNFHFNGEFLRFGINISQNDDPAIYIQDLSANFVIKRNDPATYENIYIENIIFAMDAIYNKIVERNSLTQLYNIRLLPKKCSDFINESRQLPQITMPLPRSSPASSSPASSAPASRAPASRAPASSSPASIAPASSAPASRAPASSSPASRAPASSSPASRASASSSPASSAPASRAPASSESTTPIHYTIVTPPSYEESTREAPPSYEESTYEAPPSYEGLISSDLGQQASTRSTNITTSTTASSIRGERRPLSTAPEARRIDRSSEAINLDSLQRTGQLRGRRKDIEDGRQS